MTTSWYKQIPACERPQHINIILFAGSLNFTKVVLKDKGVYTCSVISPSNQVRNASVYLNVSDQPGMLSSTYFTTVTTSSNMPAPKPTQSRRKVTTTTLKKTSLVRTVRFDLFKLEKIARAERKLIKHRFLRFSFNMKSDNA